MSKTNPEINTIGVLTGGGDAPGLNTVIRAIVRKVHRHTGWKIWGIHESFEGLITGKGNIDLTYDAVREFSPRVAPYWELQTKRTPSAIPCSGVAK
jgi:hypothetical protein